MCATEDIMICMAEQLESYKRLFGWMGSEGSG